MTHLRELNNHNTAKRMTETFGHSDNLITLSLSLSLSQALAYKRDNTPLILCAGARVNIRLSLQKCKGGCIVFSPPARQGGGDRRSIYG